MPMGPTTRDREAAEFPQLRATLAVILITLGVAGVFWVAGQVIALVTAPADIALVGRFVALDALSRSIVTPGGNVELPASFNLIIGVALDLAALNVAAGLAKQLIATGASLLENQAATLLKKLREDLARPRDPDKRA